MRKTPVAVVALGLLGACATSGSSGPRPPGGQPRDVIIIVWDGLRPDAIDPADTPNLQRLRDAGSDFTDHHATYPTFTMMNAASIHTPSALLPWTRNR